MSNHDEWDLLTQTLRERAAGVGGGSLDLESVRGRARGIKRRRTALRGAVAAVVATLAVPGGLALTTALQTPGDERPDDNIATQTPSPSPTTPAPTPRPDGTFPLTVHGLPRGEDAQLPYVSAGESRLVTPQGSIGLPEPYLMVTPYDGGYLAVGSRLYPDQVIVLDAETLDVTRTEPAGGYRIAVNGDGSRVAYVVRESDTEVRLVDAPADGTQPVTWTVEVPRGESLDPVGYLDDGAVVYNSPTTDVMGVARPGGEPTPIDGFLRVDDASEGSGLVSGLVSYGNEGGCSGVADPETGSLRWKDCAYSNLRFSPDGRYVVADASYFDGPGSPTLTVLDASTGEHVVTFSPDRGTRSVGVAQAAWEDADTVLAYVDDGGDQAMLRFDLDGSVERASEVFKARDLSLELWFAEHPRR